jgi:hypothetical protein
MDAESIGIVRAQKAEQKAEDIQHALNPMLNLGFERFHTALTMDGAVHEFELGTVRNLPAPVEIQAPVTPKRTGDRRIVLWRTMFPGRHPLCIDILRCRVQIPAEAPRYRE